MVRFNAVRRVVAGLAAAVLLSTGVVGAGVAPSLAAVTPAGASLYAYAAGGGSGASCPQTSTVASQCTLTQALAAAASGDTIYLASSGSTPYVGNWTVPAGLELTIQSLAGIATAPILDGNGGSSSGCSTVSCSGSVITVGSGSTTLHLSDFTIRNGYAGNGGGLSNGVGGIVTVTRMTFLNNTATGYTGGAISENGLTANNLTVTDSVFRGNRAQIYGGAIGIDNYQPATAVGTVTVTISGSTFDGNEVGTINSASSFPGDGGAIYAQFRGLSIANSTFSNNRGEYGGGLLLYQASPFTMSNSTVTGNVATVVNTNGYGPPHGGGILINETTTSIVHSTISGNSADSGAGGFAMDGTASVGVAASIIASQTSGDNCSGSTNLTDGGYNLASDTSCAFTGTGSQQSVNPLLATLSSNGGQTKTMFPNAGSTAIGAIPISTSATLNGATSQVCATTDQRGVTSVGACSIGAVQVFAPSITSAASGTLYRGTAGTLAITSSASPTATLSVTAGSLPTGVTFTDNGNGTATLRSSATLAATGSFPLTIQASNGIGSAATQSFTLTVGAVAPSVARSVVVSPGKKSVVVSWLAPLSNGGAPITGYVVTATPGGHSCTATSTQSTCTVGGIVDGQSYTVMVGATNAGGKSSMTAASTAVVAGTPTVAQKLKVTFPTTPHSAKLTWGAPKYANSGAVMGYRVRWCKANTCSAWFNLLASARSHFVLGRVRNVNFRVEIQARNRWGYGPVASKTFKRTT